MSYSGYSPRDNITDHGELSGLSDDDHTQYAETGLTGTGAPGVSTGNGKRVGTVYVDTDAGEGYILTDNTTDANVWSTATGGAGLGSWTYTGSTPSTTGQFKPDTTLASTTGIITFFHDPNEGGRYRVAMQEVPVGTSLVLRSVDDLGSAHVYRIDTINSDATKVWYDVTLTNTVGEDTWSNESAWTVMFLPGSAGVIGPSSAVDNHVPRWDGTTGKLVQDSNLEVSDNGVVVIDGPGTASGPFIRMTGISAAPSTSPGTGQFWAFDGTTNPTQPYFSDDAGRERRLELMPVTVTGQISMSSVDNTWYAPARAGGYYNDTTWTDTLGTGTNPSTSALYLTPPLIIFPENAEVQLMKGTVFYNASAGITAEIEVGTLDVEHADSAAGTYDTLADGPSNTFGAASTTKNYILDLTIGDSIMSPAANHHQCVYLAVKHTNTTSGVLYLTCTLWFATYTNVGWDF